MPALTRVACEEVERLDSTHLVGLLRTLLLSEARMHCVRGTRIHVPFQINVPDGGNDGEWLSEVAFPPYIPRAFSMYQSKASALERAECKAELQLGSHGPALKPQVLRVVEGGGAYVFFCRKGYTAAAIASRLEGAREAIAESGVTVHPEFELHFIDGNAITNWVNQHSAAIAAVFHSVNRPLELAVVSFNHWAGYGMMANPYQSTPNLDALLREVRFALAEPRNAVRVSGPSGVGKTRAAFEVFRAAAADEEEEKIRQMLAGSVVYVDFQRSGARIIEWLVEVVQAGISGVVVVDNCSVQNHSLLCHEVQHADSKITLLTLDFVGGLSMAVPGQWVEITPEMMREVVPRILESDPETSARLGPGGIRRIADFAQGYPQIAMMTAMAGHALDRATLNQREIVDRLLWGRGNPNDEAEEVLQCLSAFQEIGQEGRFAGQLQFIRQELLGNLDERRFHRLVAPFIANRVLQKAGDFYLVAPAPLAVALAAEWLGAFPPGQFPALMTSLSQAGLLESFARRLRQLDFSERAQELCETLLGHNGPFESAEVLASDEGSRVFRALCELNPRSGLRCLTAAVRGFAPQELRRFEVGRRNLIWSLEKLCWPAELFVEAATILRGFAAGETELWTNNATGILKQLFHLHLSGTQCPAIDRLVVLRDGLRLNNTEVSIVCVAALGSALESRHFSRSSGAEIRGTRPPEEDWRPRTNQEAWDYWHEVFQILKGVALGPDGDLAKLAAETLGKGLRGILLSPLTEALDADFNQLVHALRNWPEARDELKRVLSFELRNDSPARRAAERWVSYMEPTDLPTTLIDVVAKPGWHAEEREDGHYVNTSEENAIRLAERLVAEGTDWLPHAALLLTGDQQQSDYFGKKAAELTPDQAGLFRQCLDIFRMLPSDQRNPRLLRGIISGIGSRELVTSILSEIAIDEGLRGELLVPLTMSANPTLSDFERVQRLIVQGLLPVDVINWFSTGSVTSGFEPTAFSRLLEEIRVARPEASLRILHVAYMAQWNRPEVFEGMRELFERLTTDRLVIAKIGNNSYSHDWREITDRLVETSEGTGIIESLAEGIAGAAEIHGYYYYGEIDVPRLAGRLLSSNVAMVWPIFAAKLRLEDGNANYALLDLLCKTPFASLDDPTFEAWARENPDLLPYVAEHMPLFVVAAEAPPNEQAGEPEEGIGTGTLEELSDGIRPGRIYRWHGQAMTILELCGRPFFQSALSSSLLSFGSSGSRVPQLERRLQLLDDLMNTEETTLAEIARSVQEEVRREIEEERKVDAQRAAGIWHF